MATAYAAIVSLAQIIDQVHTYHTRQPVFVDKQLTLIENLKGKVSGMQEFLEKYSHVAETFVLEEIADAAHVAEDILESHIVADIHSRSFIDEATLERFEEDEGQTVHLFSQGLKKVILDMVTIEEEIGKINTKDPEGEFFMKLIRMTVSERGERKEKMAVAYAAVVSLIKIIYHVQLYHTDQPIFDDEQLRQIEIINDKVNYMQEFLVKYSHLLESTVPSKIVDVAHIAEDILESYIVEKATCARYKLDKNTKRNVFCEGLSKVVTEMVKINEKMGDIKENKVDDLQSPYVQFRDPASVGLFTSADNKEEVVGFDDYIKRVKAAILGSEPYLIVSISGMGGIGKTTLAKQVYNDKLIQSSFKCRGWITLTRKFDLRETLLGLLREFKVSVSDDDDCEDDDYDDDQLGEALCKHLSKVSFLIVLDDLWSTNAFEKLKFLLNGTNKSRLLVTTRLKKVAEDICSSSLQEIDVLNKGKSWELLQGKTFFGKECPTELVELGKEIARNCKGLPLSLVVIAGHLASSFKTQEVWKRVAEQTSRFVSLKDEECCRKTLFLSYSRLPIHLKPCFLYMGTFPEDHMIRVSQLIRLWVAEGYIKTENDTTLEEIALNYLMDLINRNLVSARSFGDIGNIKFCQIHDVVRDICLTEGVKERLFCNIVSGPEILQDISSQRRIVIHDRLEGDTEKVTESYLQSALLARTVSYNFEWNASSPLHFRLMRVWNIMDQSLLYPPDNIFQLTNLRYLSTDYLCNITSIGMLWNLQTLVAEVYTYGVKVCLPPVIWKMQHLRHMMLKGVEFPALPDGTCSTHDDTIVLENLQTFFCSEEFICTKEVLRRIPDVKTLKIRCQVKDERLAFYNLDNICRFEKILSLSLTFPRHETWPQDYLQHIKFPRSLMKLSLYNSCIDWVDVHSKIGCLPNLEKLIILGFSEEEVWEPVVGDFLRLKFLKLNDCNFLEHWEADQFHFPKLEQLYLIDMAELVSIPSGFGKIETLRRISLDNCTISCNDSAMTILNQRLRGVAKNDLEVIVDSEYVVAKEDDDDDDVIMVMIKMGRWKRKRMIRLLKRIDDGDYDDVGDDGMVMMMMGKTRRRRMMLMLMRIDDEDGGDDEDDEDDGDAEDDGGDGDGDGDDGGDE